MLAIIVAFIALLISMAFKNMDRKILVKVTATPKQSHIELRIAEMNISDEDWSMMTKLEKKKAVRDYLSNIELEIDFDIIMDGEANLSSFKHEYA